MKERITPYVLLPLVLVASHILAQSTTSSTSLIVPTPDLTCVVSKAYKGKKRAV